MLNNSLKFTLKLTHFNTSQDLLKEDKENRLGLLIPIDLINILAFQRTHHFGSLNICIQEAIYFLRANCIYHSEHMYAHFGLHYASWMLSWFDALRVDFRLKVSSFNSIFSCTMHYLAIRLFVMTIHISHGSLKTRGGRPRW